MTQLTDLLSAQEVEPGWDVNDKIDVAALNEMSQGDFSDYFRALKSWEEACEPGDVILTIVLRGSVPPDLRGAIQAAWIRWLLFEQPPAGRSQGSGATLTRSPGGQRFESA